VLSVLTRQAPAASALTTAIALGKHAQWLRMSRIAHDPAALVGHNGVSRATEPNGAAANPRAGTPAKCASVAVGASWWTRPRVRPRCRVQMTSWFSRTESR